MKQAITKIKSLQTELREKNSTISKLREEVQNHNKETLKQLEKKDKIIKARSDEIQKLENEFVSFKEEFVNELKTLERQKDLVSMKQLMDTNDKIRIV